MLHCKQFVNRENVSPHLVNQSPSHSDAFLHILDDALARFQARVVVQRGPDLRAHLLKRKIVNHFALAIFECTLLRHSWRGQRSRLLSGGKR